ncbi:MAG TPA: hypothetical protein DCS82_11515 [Rhodospirillaceae bacterium]|nr:hypothetical protein [Rhodospirillaceae bacterium]HAT36338.1 hypothetical protein [Rhodospirillaceae bacterium]
MANYSFRDLIAPLPESDFFDEHFASEPAFVGGETDKFESLWGWNDLNTILSKTRHWTEQTCRLVKNGSPVPPESFCVVSQKRDQIGIGRPDYERLGKIIQEGAVLHLDRMESLRPTLAATTANLRSIFCAPIEARLTYYRKAQPLTETRFENHDLFLMQIEGVSLVRLFEGSFEFPSELPGFNFDTISIDEAKKFCGEPAAEVEMTKGDMLYLPAGQFYDIMGANELAMQLIYFVRIPNGFDFASFLFRKLLDDPHFRADMPFFDDPVALEKHIETMSQRLIANVDNNNLSKSYREERITQSVKSPLAELGLPATDGFTRYRRRLTSYAFKNDGENWLLVGPDANETITPDLKPACDWMLARDFFDHRALKENFDDLSLAEETLRRLTSSGIIQIV